MKSIEENPKIKHCFMFYYDDSGLKFYSKGGNIEHLLYLFSNLMKENEKIEEFVKEVVVRHEAYKTFNH